MEEVEDSADHSDVRRSIFSTRTLARVCAGIFIAWFTVCLMLIGFQRRLVFIGHSQQLDWPLPVEASRFPKGRVFDVSVTVESGVSLAGWICVAKAAESAEEGLAQGRPVVLYLGGNAGNRSSRVKAIKSLHNVGADVFIVDYRGYAENPGTPTEENFAADARAMWSSLIHDWNVDRSRIVIWGESLGGGVATRLTAERCDDNEPPAGLILRATFASLVETASYHYPFVPVRTVLKDRFPSVERIGRVTVPYLHFHGTADRVVPYTHGRELFAAAPKTSASGIPKTFITLDGVGHNNIMYVAADEIETATRAFLQKIGFETFPAE